MSSVAEKSLQHFLLFTKNLDDFDHKVIQRHDGNVGDLQHNDVAVHDADIHQVLQHPIPPLFAANSLSLAAYTAQTDVNFHIVGLLTLEIRTERCKVGALQNVLKTPAEDLAVD